MKKTAALIALLFAMISLTAGCRTVTAPDPTPSTSAWTSSQHVSSSPASNASPEPTATRSDLAEISQRALTELAALPVKGRAPMTGYSREQFGPAWNDDVDGVTYGHNGCDTRNDILKQDLTAIAYRNGSRCVIASGTLADPYTATTIDFVRGPQSAKVQIDHVVALADAWQKGAQQLSAAQRRQLANDPRNLLAVDGPANTAKGAGDAATWLPPNKSYRCTYVAKQITVKKLYGLWVTPAEKQAMTGLLTGCAGR